MTQLQKPPPTPLETSPFKSFLMAGYECSTHYGGSGYRHDLVKATKHDVQAEADYRLLEPYKIKTVREGIRWHLIEKTPYHYDFSSVLPTIRDAHRCGIQVIWDIFHYGYPDGLDPFSSEFVDRFRALTQAFTLVLLEETGHSPILSPVNEVSFFAWAAGAAGFFNPFTPGRADELKRQLVRASLEAMSAAREVAPQTRFVQPEPAIHVVNTPLERSRAIEADQHRQSMFEAWDMLAGFQQPELGGAPEFLDIIGLNYYPANQWQIDSVRISLEDSRRRPFLEITRDIYSRYGRPMVITETGAEDLLRPGWLLRMTANAERIVEAGMPLWGLCVYPILDHPGWDDDRNVKCGLWGYEEAGDRILEPTYGAAVLECSERLERLVLPALKPDFVEGRIDFREVL